MLKPVTAGLRALHYDSNQVAKVQIQVQPGDVLAVSEDLADQLQRADTHFKPVDDAGIGPRTGAEDAPAEPEPDAKPKSGRRKA